MDSGLSGHEESFKARVDKLRAEIEALKAENNMLRQKLIDANRYWLKASSCNPQWTLY
ncbi:hypothetical protein BWQ96_10489 [Gracilariopsis chorda]|uniref:Uncharacterized protein n=1 Tax=Gracilariopsis chorda TaxID=448386 RepID=A0A2V3ICG9_9FLOR|nr:hypothetical protein BWQ96_10489 [Gracilariopsis chorda]|eukprot:PXF39792.1 hypothetical protein BWQ96_10489 [Gracilariopsis chorda]